MSDQETTTLQGSIRRLWLAVSCLSLTTFLSIGLLAWVQLRTPEQIRVANPDGSRTATLSPDSLLITLDGEQRALLDCHSGLILHDRTKRFVQLDPAMGLLLRDGPANLACAVTYTACPVSPGPQAAPVE